MLKKAVTTAVEASVPKREYTTPNLNIRLKPDTRAVMRACDKAKKEGSRTYRSLRNKALSMIQRDKVQRNIEKIRKGGPSAAWQIVNEVTGKERGYGLPLPDECESNVQAAN